MTSAAACHPEQPYFLQPPPHLENRGEQTRKASRLQQSGGFFHDLVDFPFLLALPTLPLSLSHPLRDCSHRIVESCTSLSHRYLMARVKSPITQLPCRTYVPAYVAHVRYVPSVYTFLHARSRGCVGAQAREGPRICTLYAARSYPRFCLSAANVRCTNDTGTSANQTCLVLNYNLRIYRVI